MAKPPHLSKSEILAVLTAAVMLLVFLGLRTSGGHKLTLLEVAVPVSFAAVAWLMKGVTFSGALTGAAVAFIFYGFAGWRLFLLLFAVFAITLVATKIGTAHKKTVETRASDGRSGSQVMANLFVPSLFLIVADFVVLPYIAMGAAISALAELAADTVSSEIGEAFGQPTYLITTWRRAETGANGGLSLLGTMAGIAAALTVAVSALLLNLYGPKVWLCAIAGVVGMLIDSLLGATLESRGWLNNDAVNLLSTGAAALLGVAFLIV